MSQEKRKGKSGVHNIEQDRTEGTVCSGLDFEVAVDRDLYKLRKDAGEKPIRRRKKRIERNTLATGSDLQHLR